MVIETERLLLRPLSADDLDDFAAMYADPRVAGFLGGTATGAETAEWLERRMRDYERQGYGHLTMVEKETGAFVGRCGLAHWEIEGRDELEVGYALVRRAWGKGFATEAAAAVRDYALSELGAKRLIALVAPENERSARVAEKLGMLHERDVSFHGSTHRLFSLSV